ncbi:zinc-binding dehydrogenase [bacterium]|nr:zinc-binding dehydrogenase [bacterium]
MKAAVIEEPGKLVVREVPEPVMGDYDCLCEGLYGTTCSGTDLHLLGGHPLFGIKFPTILGHESIGRVIEVGPKVECFKVGDLVTRLCNRPTEDLRVHWGGFAERGLVSDWRAMERDGVPLDWTKGIQQVLPRDFDPARSTMVITWRETFSFITRMGVAEGAKVLVMGTGGNGLSYMNHAVNLGAATVLAIGSPAREETARAVGATDFISYHEDDLVAAARERGLDGFDLMIDAVGKIGQLDRVMPLVRPDGVVAIYGVDDYGRVTINPQRAPGSFTFANKGYWEYETHDRVVELIQRGRLRAEHWLDLDHAFPLTEMNEALAAIRERRVVKALVKLSGD